MSDYTEACLTALCFYEAAKDCNKVNLLSIVRESGERELLTGLCTLVGALLQSCAASTGSTEDELVELLRAMWVLNADGVPS